MRALALRQHLKDAVIFIPATLPADPDMGADNIEPAGSAAPEPAVPYRPRQWRAPVAPRCAHAAYRTRSRLPSVGAGPRHQEHQSRHGAGQCRTGTKRRHPPEWSNIGAVGSRCDSWRRRTRVSLAPKK